MSGKADHPGGVAAVLVAAGRGRRMGGETPKQYLPLNGPCALRRSIDRFLGHPDIRTLCVVMNPDDATLYAAAVAGLDDPRLLPPVSGGDSRAHSVRNGLEALVSHAPQKVLIHDAARPFVSADLIGSVIAALDNSPGACAALPVVDALWVATPDGHADRPQPRDGLWRAQTPQGFQFDVILSAHRSLDGTAADDVAVAREAGLAVQFVTGEAGNYKITTPDDLAQALRDAGEDE